MFVHKEKEPKETKGGTFSQRAKAITSSQSKSEQKKEKENDELSFAKKVYKGKW